MFLVNPVHTAATPYSAHYIQCTSEPPKAVPIDEEDWLFVAVQTDEEDWLIVAVQDVNEEKKKMNNCAMNC